MAGEASTGADVPVGVSPERQRGGGGAGCGNERLCHKHAMVRASLTCWFVCQYCGLPATCPGCVVRVSVGALLHLCQAHQHLADVVDGRVVVWATEKAHGSVWQCGKGGVAYVYECKHFGCGSQSLF